MCEKALQFPLNCFKKCRYLALNEATGQVMDSEYNYGLKWAIIGSFLKLPGHIMDKWWPSLKMSHPNELKLGPFAEDIKHMGLK